MNYIYQKYEPRYISIVKGALASAFARSLLWHSWPRMQGNLNPQDGKNKKYSRQNEWNKVLTSNDSGECNDTLERMR